MGQGQDGTGQGHWFPPNLPALFPVRSSLACFCLPWPCVCLCSLPFCQGHTLHTACIPCALFACGRQKNIHACCVMCCSSCSVYLLLLCVYVLFMCACSNMCVCNHSWPSKLTFLALQPPFLLPALALPEISPPPPNASTPGAGRLPDSDSRHRATTTNSEYCDVCVMKCLILLCVMPCLSSSDEMKEVEEKAHFCDEEDSDSSNGLTVGGRKEGEHCVLF